MLEQIKDTIETVNIKINSQNRYGIRTFKTIDTGYIIAWSNNNRVWYIRSYYQVKKGQTIRIDSNEIFIHAKKSEIESWITGNKLNKLPLFYNSYEYKNQLED